MPFCWFCPAVLDNCIFIEDILIQCAQIIIVMRSFLQALVFYVNTSDSKPNSIHRNQQTNMLCKLDLGVDVLTAFLFASCRDVVHCRGRSSLGIGGSTVITLYILHLHL